MITNKQGNKLFLEDLKNIKWEQFSDLEDNSEDLEQMDSPLIDVSEINVDNNYLNFIHNSLSQQGISFEESKPLIQTNIKKDYSNESQIDTYLKQMILQVLVEDFMPILEKRFLKIITEKK